MASYYIRSGAGGAANGTSWANAYTTLTAALSGKAAGDIFYISEDHAESTASGISLTSPGSLTNPCFFYCVDHNGSVPPVSADLRTTGEIAATGNSGSITMAGAWVIDGLIFHMGKTGATGGLTFEVASTAERFAVFRNSALRSGTTGNGTFRLGGGAVGEYIEMTNTTMQWAGTTGTVAINARVLWRDTASAITGATFPATLFTFPLARGGKLECRGVDLSALGSGKTLVSNGSGVGTSHDAIFVDCKLDASVTKFATPTAPGGVAVDFIRSGSNGINYDITRGRAVGTLVPDTTIVRTGGASDGVTPISWKIDTTSMARWSLPFEAAPIVVWNAVDGSSVTVDIEGIWGSGSVPNNDDIWIEVEYLGDNSSPKGSRATGTKSDNLAAGTALDAGSGTWGGSTTKFKMSATFTPQQSGFIAIYVRAGKASSTFYVDPEPVINGVTVSRSFMAPMAFVSELQSGAGFPASRIQTGM